MKRVEVAPYWNVNCAAGTVPAISSTVEVAPYWNVNTIMNVLEKEFNLGRSSTILECKCEN